MGKLEDKLGNKTDLEKRHLHTIFKVTLFKYDRYNEILATAFSRPCL